MYLWIICSKKVTNKQASKLSGGWQRKLSIALALVSKPKILFLDEPTLELDVFARRELWNTIIELKKNMTIILTTHYMEEAEALSDRIGVMKEGKLLFVGTRNEMFDKTGKKRVEYAFIEIVLEGMWFPIEGFDSSIVSFMKVLSFKNATMLIQNLITGVNVPLNDFLLPFIIFEVIQ